MLRLDTQLRDFDARAVPAQAQRFERLGFDGVWTFEAAHDPFLPLALAANATEKLEIGTNITVAFARAPFAVAQTAFGAILPAAVPLAGRDTMLRPGETVISV